MGTAYALEHFKETYYWDWATRAARLNGIPGEIEAHEFDYKGENHVVYQENGVTVRAWPAIHECFHTPRQMADWYNQAPAYA